MMCRLFIGQKFRKKIYPSSKNTDSGRGGGAKSVSKGAGQLDDKAGMMQWTVDEGKNLLNTLQKKQFQPAAGYTVQSSCS